MMLIHRNVNMFVESKLILRALADWNMVNDQSLRPQTFRWPLRSTANFVRYLNERVGQGAASDLHDFSNHMMIGTT